MLNDFSAEEASLVVSKVHVKLSLYTMIINVSTTQSPIGVPYQFNRCISHYTFKF